MVGDSHAMGVASQIMQHMLEAAEGRLGIDDPVPPMIALPLSTLIE
jgi:hypothetical protein